MNTGCHNGVGDGPSYVLPNDEWRRARAKSESDSATKEYRALCLFPFVFHHSLLLSSPSSWIGSYFTSITSGPIIRYPINTWASSIYQRRMHCNRHLSIARCCQRENGLAVNFYRFVVKSTGIRLTRYNNKIDCCLFTLGSVTYSMLPAKDTNNIVLSFHNFLLSPFFKRVWIFQDLQQASIGW